MTQPTVLAFFIDWSLGQRAVPEALREAGAVVETHLEHFEPDAPDEIWLTVTSERGWIVLTKDARIGNRALELLAIARSNARVFILAAGNRKRAEMAAILVAALAKIEKFVQGNSAPFIAKLYPSGRIALWKSHTQLLKLLK